MLEEFSDRVRANSDLMTKMSAVVARAGQMMAARQAAAISEAIDDLTRLMHETLSETGNPAAISRAHAAYAEAMFRRSLRNLQLAAQNLAELSASALELAAPIEAARDGGDTRGQD
jgi:hypothetical protein